MSETFNYSWAFKPDPVRSWAYWNNAFSSEECDKIVHFCSGKQLKEATVTHLEGTNILSSYRDSSVVFFPPCEDTAWVYQRLTDIVTNLNERFFDFDLWGFSEGLQFTRYSSPGGKYDDHIDCIQGGPVRKLSVVVQLTDETTYDGGNFEIFDSKTPTQLRRDKGTLLLFPSYSLHRVTPVTSGVRHSLVGWITGKPFR